MRVACAPRSISRGSDAAPGQRWFAVEVQAFGIGDGDQKQIEGRGSRITAINEMSLH